jgi:cysteinyl-tRNA synthetase
MFPHHENEIAQTEAATGKELATYWLHAEHLLIEGGKMAKSEGNVYTLADVTSNGFRPLALRILFLQSHYRSKLNFTWKSLEAAAASFQRIQEFYNRVPMPLDPPKEDPKKVAKLLAQTRKQFAAAMDNDLNTAEALAAVFDMIREANALINKDALDENDIGAIMAALKEFNEVLGVFSFSLIDLEISPELQELIDGREEARADNDFKTADTLRKKIEKAGFTIEDFPNGPRLRKK